MSLFLAVSPDNARALIIRADAWHDAKRFAETLFSDVVDRNKILVTLTEDVGQRVDYELRWDGSDAGVISKRQLEVRELIKLTESDRPQWGSWRRLE